MQAHRSAIVDTRNPLVVDRWSQLREGLTPLLLTPQACPDFLSELSQQALRLMQLVHQDPDLAIFHVIRATPDKVLHYGVLHSIHTAILLCLIGGRKNWNAIYTVGAIKAALTMNLSITALQTTLAQQTTPLTPDQRQSIDRHPQDSAALLETLGVDDEHWLRAVWQHHERPDGKGYPHHLTEVTQWADALRTCDVFGAKVSPRISRVGMLSPQAAEAIFRQRSTGYFGATIIRELGLYPPGCLVTLSSGETAVVLRRTSSPMQPEVALLTTVNGHALETPIRCPTGQVHRRSIQGAAADADLSTRFSTETLFDPSL